MNKIYEDITIVTVLYNSKKSAQSFFNNLENFSIIVVDNGRNEKVIETIKGYKNIKIISKNKNIGYGNAINLGSKFVKTRYFFCMNPDTVIYKNTLSLFSLTSCCLLSSANSFFAKMVISLSLFSSFIIFSKSFFSFLKFK